MNALHIVQGGIENGDTAWLEKAARKGLSRDSWVVPKSAKIGDDFVVFISGYGFFATARIGSLPKPRIDWGNRYGAGLTAIRLIKPAISLPVIRQAIPELTWANYPRSITTPASAPSCRSNGSPYLEPHHTTRLADDGPDHPARVIGLCPDCHRRAHYGADAKGFNDRLKKRLANLEPR